MSLTLKN